MAVGVKNILVKDASKANNLLLIKEKNVFNKNIDKDAYYPAPGPKQLQFSHL